MPMFAPYIYLLPLQHAHTLRPPSPAPHYPPSNPPARHQEGYPPSQYPPAASLPPQYDQAAVMESSQVGEMYNQPTYPVTDAPAQCTSGPAPVWEQHQMPPPTNATFPGGYPAPNQPYSVPRRFPHSYHPVPALQQYPPGAPPYAPSLMGYQSPPAHDELQVNQAPPEQQASTNGDSSALIHGAVAAKMANVSSSSRTVVVPGYCESLARACVSPPGGARAPLDMIFFLLSCQDGDWREFEWSSAAGRPPTQ